MPVLILPPLILDDEDDHELCNFYTYKNSDKLLNNQLHVVYIYIYIDTFYKLTKEALLSLD